MSTYGQTKEGGKIDRWQWLNEAASINHEGATICGRWGGGRKWVQEADEWTRILAVMKYSNS
jgi:hypothetical protein